MRSFANRSRFFSLQILTFEKLLMAFAKNFDQLLFNSVEHLSNETPRFVNLTKTSPMDLRHVSSSAVSKDVPAWIPVSAVVRDHTHLMYLRTEFMVIRLYDTKFHHDCYCPLDFRNIFAWSSLASKTSLFIWKFIARISLHRCGFITHLWNIITVFILIPFKIGVHYVVITLQLP
jgi:hypothetical protein